MRVVGNSRGRPISQRVCEGFGGFLLPGNFGGGGRGNETYKVKGAWKGVGMGRIPS